MVEAAGVKQARASLAAGGILAESLAPAGRPARVGPETRALIYRELSSLLRAGMPMVNSLGVLMASPELAGAAAIVAGVRDKVQEGSDLAGAIRSASLSVRPFEEAVIHAGEVAGSLPESLENLAILIEHSERVGHRVRSALIYPSMVFVVGIVVAAVMMGLLVPRAQDILAQVHGSMPRITVFMVGFSRWWVRWFPAVLLLVIVVGVWFRSRIAKDAAFRREVDRRLFGAPLIGRGYALVVNIRFARTLSALTRSGVSLVEGLLIAGRATGSPWIGSMSEEESESVRHGARLSDAVRRMGPLAEALPGWIQVGEASGDLGNLLEQAAVRYQEKWERFSTRAVGILEPMLILVIGGFVLLVTLAVLLPVLSLSRGLAGG
jgi:general secretion pathway protein F